MPRAGVLFETCLGRGQARGRKTAYLAKVEGAYRPASYFQLVDQVERAALALHDLGLAKGDRLAVLSENRPEWIVADMGAVSIGVATTPIYATYPAARVRHILRDAGAKAVLVSNASQLAKVLEVRGDLPDLAAVIVAEPAAAKGVAGALGWEQFLARGRALRDARPGLHAELAAAVRPEDLATVIYTSGTTGVEKGVMLTHANFTTNIVTALETVELRASDVHLSFLPLSHILERTAGYYCLLAAGGAIAFAESVETLGANMLEAQPTVLISVPRVLEKIHAAVVAGVAQRSPVQQGIFRWGIEVGRRVDALLRAGRPVPAGLRLQRRLADRLVYGKIRARTGGRLRLVVSGGAPLATEIGEFFAALGLLVLEGYGLTETSPLVSVNTPTRRRFGTVGPPVRDVEVRIAPDGEILVRGPNVMRGYWNMPEATREVLEPEGWFHTGDVGALDADGFLAITDRKKDLIVLSTGKNVAPQLVEAQFKGSPWVNQVLVLGDKHKYVAALLVPAMEQVVAFARAQGLPTGDPDALLREPAVLDALSAHVRACCAPLAPFERIKRFAVVPHEFTVDGGEMTPSLKLRRRVIVDRFLETIADLYGDEERAPADEPGGRMARLAKGA